MKNSMIKNSIRTFFDHFVCLFVAMGVVYLFLLVAILFLLGAAAQNVTQTLSAMTALIHTSTEQSSAAVNEFLAYSIEQLSWNGDLIGFLRRILDIEWIRTTLRGFFDVLNASSEGFEEEFTAIATEFSRNLKASLTAAAVLCAAGIVAANFVTRFALRRRTVKHGLKRFLVAHTVVPVLQSLILIVALPLLAVIKMYGLLLFAALLLLASGLSLTCAWLVHRDKSLKLRTILTTENILSQLAVTGLALLFNLTLAGLLTLLDPVLAVLVMLPVAIYTFNVADINAETFICTRLGKTETL